MALPIFALVLAAAAAWTQPTVAQETDADAADDTPTIAEIAAGDDRFSTLVAAADAAGLVGALADRDADLTVFAPTNDAFAALPEGTVASLLEEENRDTLTKILLAHVVGRSLNAAQVTSLDTLRSLATTGLDVVVDEDGGVTVAGATVVVTDIEAANGIIHVIDTVIVPSDDDTLPTIAEAAAGTTLATLLEVAGLVETFTDADGGPYTVFAPTEAAFEALPEDLVAALLAEENRDTLRAILTYHVVAGDAFAFDVVAAIESDTALETLQGESVGFSLRDGSPYINDAKISTTDVVTSNGVIHFIDAVIVPPTVAEALGLGEKCPPR